MKPKLTKSQARAFRKRWRLVNARELEELRTTSMEVRLRQFNTLFRWAKEFGLTAEIETGEAEVWEGWMRLRDTLRGILHAARNDAKEPRTK